MLLAIMPFTVPKVCLYSVTGSGGTLVLCMHTSFKVFISARNLSEISLISISKMDNGGLFFLSVDIYFEIVLG